MSLISRRSLIAGLLPALWAADRSPNLVVITADGWRGVTLRSRGDTFLFSPNVDRLAREGVDFAKAYAARPAPPAGPSPLLTGCFPHRTDAPPVLRTLLEEMGYVWGDLPAATPAALGEFIRRNQTKPFVAWCPGSLPADPDERFRRIYTGRPIPGRANMPEDRTQPGWREFAGYHAALTQADAALGQALAVLEETGLAPDTIVVFTSQFGEMLGSHGLMGADEFWEESVLVPLLVRYPRRLRTATVEYPVSLTDLAPTLLSLCGAEVPRAVHGRNLASLIAGGPGVRPESVFVEGRLNGPDGWRLLIRGVNKLVVDLRHQVQGLYNLGLDPYETENQATPRATELVRAEMRAILKDWMSRTGDWAVRPR